MKYIFALALLLTLIGCGENSTAPQGSSDVAEEKPQSFLDQPLKGKISQKGLYRLVRSSGVVDNPDTTTGKAISNPVIQRVRSTERIPLIKGARMYLQYRLWSFPNQPAYADLRRVLTHPEMTLPDGSVTTGSDFMMKRRVSSNQVIGYTGYGFDEDYEMVEGDWIFEIWYGKEKLIEQKFVTYWPDENEIAVLLPVLELGNKVLTRMESPDNPDSRRSWPRVIVGEDDPGAPPAVGEAKREMEEPLRVTEEE